ncbi:hypothetical protein E2562_013730 [Oryza meyeriana var. granulata]|uniref:Calmodulin-binding domain-containing protein n=1 Tax=Oryza meyeriana var. granulata TaxID=110450 RepID=A0A6G1BK60_9ORYZ|nr:hypothetical protein E2562_013730 [Oryza meyeriana var. granulata]
MGETTVAAGSSDGRRPRRSGDAKAAAGAVPGYLRPSVGSCHHVCKYGGAHPFEEREPRRPAQPMPRKQQQQPQPPATEIDQRTTPPAVALAKLRSASSRRRVGDLTKPEKPRKPAVAAAAFVVDDDTGKKDAGAVVWKDIVAYESSPQPPEKTTIAGGDVKKYVSVTKGKKSTKSSSHGKAKIITEQTDDIAANNKPADGSVKKKKLIKSVGSKLTGKPPPSPELQSGETATPPSDKNKKMIKNSRTKSASRSSTSFKVIRSKSSRTAAAPPPEEQDPAPAATRLRFFRRSDVGGSSSSGNGVQLRIRSLRRRGSIGGGSTMAGFVVPAVALRHQKTLEKKSRRLYNSVIEETAGKLVKARKSRVMALVGAFESLISKIGK